MWSSKNPSIKSLKNLSTKVNVIKENTMKIVSTKNISTKNPTTIATTNTLTTKVVDKAAIQSVSTKTPTTIATTNPSTTKVVDKTPIQSVSTKTPTTPVTKNTPTTKVVDKAAIRSAEQLSKETRRLAKLQSVYGAMETNLNLNKSKIVEKNKQVKEKVFANATKHDKDEIVVNPNAILNDEHVDKAEAFVEKHGELMTPQIIAHNKRGMRNMLMLIVCSSVLAASGIASVVAITNNLHNKQHLSDVIPYSYLVVEQVHTIDDIKTATAKINPKINSNFWNEVSISSPINGQYCTLIADPESTIYRGSVTLSLFVTMDLSDLILVTYLGGIIDENPSEIKDAVMRENPSITNEFWNHVQINTISGGSVIIKANDNDLLYKGEIACTYILKDNISIYFDQTDIGSLYSNSELEIKNAIIAVNPRIPSSFWTEVNIENIDLDKCYITVNSSAPSYFGTILITFYIKSPLTDAITENMGGLNGDTEQDVKTMIEFRDSFHDWDDVTIGTITTSGGNLSCTITANSSSTKYQGSVNVYGVVKDEISPFFDTLTIPRLGVGNAYTEATFKAAVESVNSRLPGNFWDDVAIPGSFSAGTTSKDINATLIGRYRGSVTINFV
ncbi:MAG: hypothetical protein Ta2E_02550 [Mycoplasmoidaceae bacterium]|nr:MAG: hypothetical protein Ta2E_02550 [Mycoplasmoidaceae bacterium]